MKIKLISFLALCVLAFTFVFVSPPDARAAAPTVKTEKSNPVKFPPNVLNSFRQISIAFVIEQSLFQRDFVFQRDRFLLPFTNYEGLYRIAFRPPDDVCYLPKDQRSQIFEQGENLLTFRPKPEIVRMV